MAPLARAILMQCKLIPIFASAVSALLSSGIGAAGFGRLLFDPTCCYACVNSIWALTLDCSQSLANETFAVNSPECHASSNTYLESLAWCLKQQCPGEGIEDAQIASVWNKIAGDGLPVAAWQTYLASPRLRILPLGATALTQSSLIDPTTYQRSRDTIVSYAAQEKYHEAYATALVVACVAFALLIGMKHGLDHLLLRILHRPMMKPLLVEKYLLLPAFIGKRHLRILPWNLGYVPQRSTSLMITIFVAVNVVFNFFNFPSFANDTWYVSSSALYTSNLANRLSVLAIANLALAIMLSGRNSIIMYITGCSRTTILAYHRWAGRVAVIKGVAHAAIYLSTTDKYGVNIFTPVGALHYIGCEGSYWNFGIATLGIFAAIALLSLAPIRVPWYEAFLIIHVALAVVGLVTLYYHLSFRFHGQYGYEVWLYVAFAFWGFDRLVRLIRIAVLNYGLMTRGTPPAKLELLPGSNFIKVTVYPSTPWAVQPGHYCFLYFSNITWFWESHPFSIATWDNGAKQSVAAPSYTTSRECASTLDKVELGTGGPGMGSALNPLDPSEKSVALVQSQSLPPSITFIIRPCSGITKRLQARLMAAAPGWSPPVLIEGPYGRSASSVFAAETVLAFAGGVGITGILGYLNDYTSKATSKTLRNADKSFRARRFTLHWLVQFKADVEAIKPLLPDANTLTDLDVHVHIFCREERSDRLQFGDEIRRERDALGQNMSLSVLTCAPPTMSDEIRASAVETDSRQGATLMFMEEAFAW